MAWLIADGGALSHTIENLTNGQTYDVQVLADSLAGQSAWSATASATLVANDYDSDDDGLIEVDSLAKLNAIRYDPDGDGAAADDTNTAGLDEAAAYATAFPNPAPGMGCRDADHDDDPNTAEQPVCTGYELTANLDFDTGTAGDRTDDEFANVNDMGTTDTGDDVTQGWEPIGSQSSAFSATFEGNGNTIANLFIDRGSDLRLGLFARLQNATVRDLTLTGAGVTGNDWAGILAGRTFLTTVISGVSVSGDVTAGGDFAGGLVGQTSNNTTIEDSSASGSVTGNSYLGGLVGSNAGEISRSRSSANVSGDRDSDSEYLGGLVGYTYGSITESFATGSVGPLDSGDGVDSAGGLVGEIGQNPTPIAITAGYATGAVTGNKDVGGLIGKDSGAASRIVASYATGSVTGSEDVGGLIGTISGASASVVAGYSTGAVTGTTNTGGLIGSADSSTTVTDSYWDTESSGQSASAGGTGKTGAELRAPTGYAGIYANWNLDLDNADSDDDLATGGDDPWDFGANYNYPTLRDTGGKQKGPGPVSNLAAALDARDNLVARWAAPADTGDGELTVRYAGRYSADGGSTWTDFGPRSGTTFTINNPADADFRFEVWAISRGAAHTRSATASVTAAGVAPPVAPGGFSVTPGRTHVELRLRWNRVIRASSYVVEWATNDAFTEGVGTTTVRAGNSPPNQFTRYIGGLSAETQYWVRVASVNSVGQGDWTPAVSVRTVPVVSVAPGASPIAEGTDAEFTILASGPPTVNVEVSFTVSGGAAFGVTGETRTVTLPAGVSVATITVATAGDAVAEDAQDVTVTVNSGAGYAISRDHGSASVRVNDDDGGLNGPSNLRVVPGISGVLRAEEVPFATYVLTWDAPEGNPTSAITGYELQESQFKEFSRFITTKEFGANRRTHTARKGNDPQPSNRDHPNLRLRETAHFRIRALTGTGDDVVAGPWSPVVFATASEADESGRYRKRAGRRGNGFPPLAPDVIAVAGDGSLSVYWGIPALRTGSGKGHTIVAYDLRRREGSGGAWTTVEDVWTYGSGVLKYEFVSPSNNQAYDLQVRAHSAESHDNCSALNQASFNPPSTDLPADKCAVAAGHWSSIVTATPADYDADDDGLIEVRNLAQLNAIRYDLDGDGVVTDDPSTTGTNEFTEYTNAFHYPALAQGCPDTGCNGYELTADLDFDENGDGNRNDTWNTGAGWEPIGIFSDDGDAANDAAFTPSSRAMVTPSATCSSAGAAPTTLGCSATPPSSPTSETWDWRMSTSPAGTTSVDWQAGTRPTSAPPT